MREDIEQMDELLPQDNFERRSMVLIISTAETFLVKGLTAKLTEIGVDVSYSTTKIKSIKEYAEKADYYVLYMDESVKELADVLVFLNDICTEKEKKMILIGTRIEYEAVMTNMIEKNVLEWFERPLDMNVFIQRMQDYLDAAAIEARKKVILIVDDDVTYMRLIADWLKDIYRIGMANSGAQAIAWLAKNQADLILLDYEMPVTTGPQILAMLKCEASTSQIPVMFLTGKGDRESIMKVLTLHPADYLLKTIDRKTLRMKLEKYFLSKRIK
ncbi:MAG: response regulator [Lachnospiraceae bacterium]|nr:response regulator [Lachnospiraceae bacterium]